MNYCVKLFLTECEDFSDCSKDFVDDWKGCYPYPNEDVYECNITKDLTTDLAALQNLYEWKSTFGTIPADQQVGVDEKKEWLSECVKSGKDKNQIIKEAKKKYLCTEINGPIWNIFFLNILDPDHTPMFDQHTDRAKKYIETGKIIQNCLKNKSNKFVYQRYMEYVEFIDVNFKGIKLRDVDKALFAFGKFLNEFQPNFRKAD